MNRDDRRRLRAPNPFRPGSNRRLMTSGGVFKSKSQPISSSSNGVGGMQKEKPDTATHRG